MAGGFFSRRKHTDYLPRTIAKPDRPAMVGLQKTFKQLTRAAGSAASASPASESVFQSGWLPTCILPHTRSTFTSSSAVDATPHAQLPAQQAVTQLQQSARLVSRLATLAALAATYRDLYVAVDSLYKRQVLGSTNPLLDHNPSSNKRINQKDAESSSPQEVRFPVRDVTKLPDTDKPEGLQLNPQYMDKITCWMQLQPNHVETSSQLMTGINLFPPQEATYPTFVDFDAAMRLLDQHRSRKRVKLIRQLRKRQDKYQLSTWDHHTGEA